MLLIIIFINSDRNVFLFALFYAFMYLCIYDRMFLALGCARGLEALHSFSSHLCHRDIKSMNFLGSI